jgi:L-threonylcarbamoyladenylate synthase
VIVLDASAAVEILLGSETGQLVLDRLKWHAEAHVPEHFHIEVISALRRYSLRGELGELQAARAMATLRDLRVIRYPVLDLRDVIWELRERLSAYDAAYLALARTLDLSLLTADAGLVASARAEGRLSEIESPSTLNAADAWRLRRCLAAGEVAVFPTDTVYGLACDPGDEVAVRRLYELKGRPPDQPSAVMFFTLPAALDALPELGERERAALQALLPGPLSVLLPNPQHRFPLTCGGDTLGLRVPLLPEGLAVLQAVEAPILQSSANLSGGPDARRLADVPAPIRDGADLVLDGGELPGIASTVLDLRAYARTGTWRIVREGPIAAQEIARRLGASG